MSKTMRTIVTVICVLCLLPLSAQEKPDTVYTFRFVPDRDMFYVPYGGNNAELERLMQCVEQYRADILSGETPLHVDGYSTAGQGEAENLAMSKVRSNRVKSELIVRQKLTEECFITKNHSGGGDYVTVRIVIPADNNEEARLATERAEKEQLAVEHAEQQRIATEKAEQERIARTGQGRQPCPSTGRSRKARSREIESRRFLYIVPPCQPAALGDPHSRPWHRVAHQPVRGHHGERLVDLLDME